MEIIHNIALDVSRHGVQASIPITRGENGVHRLVVTLQNKGVPIKFLEGDSAVLYIDTDVFDPVTLYTSKGIYPNSLIYTVTTRASAVAGSKKATFQISQPSLSMMFTADIMFNVCENGTYNSNVLDSPPYAAVLKAHAQAESLCKQAEEKIESVDPRLEVMKSDYTAKIEDVNRDLSDYKNYIESIVDEEAKQNSIPKRNAKGELKAASNIASSDDVLLNMETARQLISEADNQLRFYIENHVKEYTVPKIQSENLVLYAVENKKDVGIRATPNGDIDSVIARDSFGRAEIQDPEGELDIANKRYVDNYLSTYDFIKVVTSLPFPGVVNHIYLVPIRGESLGNENLFEEYVWIDDGVVDPHWEPFGPKQAVINLSEYAKTSYVDEQIRLFKESLINVSEVGQ